MPGGLQAASLVAARLGLTPGQQLPSDVVEQLRTTAAELAAAELAAQASQGAAASQVPSVIFTDNSIFPQFVSMGVVFEQCARGGSGVLRAL